MTRREALELIGVLIFALFLLAVSGAWWSGDPVVVPESIEVRE